MEFIDVQPHARASGSICLPGSKSVSNRALLLAALAQGQTTLTCLLESDDTRVMRDALAALGVVTVPGDRSEVLTVTGCGGTFAASAATLFVGNSGIRPARW